MRNPRKTALASVATAVTVLVSGCQFNGAASIPLPGGVGNGPGAYKVTVDFTDVLDLVPQSAVKVNDVTVGSVESISLHGYTAQVLISIRKGVVLPANARASLRQTSLLGEKFIAMEEPVGVPPEGTLRNGATIGLNRTTRDVQVEEILGALSLVLNGGSLEQIQVIDRELNAALKGRESNVRDLLTQLNIFVGGLDKQKAQIVRALDGLDRLTARLAAQRQTLETGLRDIPPGLAVLADQRAQITQVLTGLSRLGDVAVHVIHASQQNTTADLLALEPILTQLNAAGKNLPDSLELLTTYPFPRTVDQGIKGDYANLFATVDINLFDTAKNTGIVPSPIASLLPSPPALPPLPGVPGAPAVPVPVPLPTPAPSALLPTVPGVGGLAATFNGSLLRLLLGGLS